MRALILNNVGTRLIFSTGLLALALSAFAGANHFFPLTKSMAAYGISVQVLQQVTLVLSLALFAGARISAQLEGRKVRSMLYLLSEFWEFRPGRERPRSYKLMEWAHLALIATMFLRALFQ